MEPYKPTPEEIDQSLRQMALSYAQSLTAAGGTAHELVEQAQIIEGYLRDGRLPAPAPQQAKAV